MPKTSLSAFRALLHSEREQLLAEVRARIAASEDGTGLGRHSRLTDDDGKADATAEVDVTMLIRESQELQEVEAALARIDEGSYGICNDCGEAIDRARLKATPAVRRCLPCQARHEQARDRLPHPGT